MKLEYLVTIQTTKWNIVVASVNSGSVRRGPHVSCNLPGYSVFITFTTAWTVNSRARLREHRIALYRVDSAFIQAAVPCIHLRALLFARARAEIISGKGQV